MTLPFKPMLSASLDGVDLSTLKYPLLASPKLDGVRCLIWKGVAYSRNAKPIRNHFVQAWAKDLHNLDGEIIVGSPTDPHCLANTQSGVMSFEGEPDFKFFCFDRPERTTLEATEKDTARPRVLLLSQNLVHNSADVEFEETEALREGYEGLMLRDPSGPYKHGRSTLREGYLMKLKRFQDGEATVIALEEGHSNQNELERDELGRAKRSKVSSGLTPSGMVGTLIVNDPTWGALRLAPGTMTHAERIALLASPASIVGRTVHWRSFGYGVKDKPRFPRYYGVRDDS